VTEPAATVRPTRAHDHLSDVYDRWLSGDESAGPCREFYLRTFGDVRGLVLEMGVGTGRITNGLTERGVRVVGLDHALPMLRSTRGERANGWPGLVQGRFQHLPFREAFAAVICPMRTIGHLLTEADRRATFAGVFRVLAPGGRFTFDHYNIDLEWARAHDGRPRVMYAGPDTEREDAAVHIWDRYDYDFAGQKLHCTVTIELAGWKGQILSSKTVEFDFRWFPHEELLELARTTGFEVEHCYGDFAGAPFTESADHMVWVLRKPLAEGGRA
jgi:SAM-dependent methyltransferase